MPFNNLNQGWGGAPVSPAQSTSSDGTQAAPVIRRIGRKYTYLLRNWLPQANEVWQSQWVDTQQTGAHFIYVVVGNTTTGWNTVNNAIQIQGTNDTGSTDTQVILAQSGFDNILTAYKISAFVPTRYWRVQLTAANTSYAGRFLLTATEMDTEPTGVVAGKGGGQVPSSTFVGLDNFGNANLGPAILSYMDTSSLNLFNALAGVALYQTNGGTWSAPRLAGIVKTIAAVAVTAGTPVAVWTPGAGKKFRLMGFMVSSSAAGSVIFKDTSATEIVRTPLMAAGIGLASPPMGNGILSVLANNALNVDVTATGNVSGFVFGTEE